MKTPSKGHCRESRNACPVQTLENSVNPGVVFFEKRLQGSRAGARQLGFLSNASGRARFLFGEFGYGNAWLAAILRVLIAGMRRCNAFTEVWALKELENE